MTPLLFALLLQAQPAAPAPAAPASAAPASATPPAAAPAAPSPITPVTPPPTTPAPASEPSAADTLAGLEETYRTTCGQTGILYYSYSELCDSLRKQITEYQRQLDREARGRPAVNH